MDSKALAVQLFSDRSRAFSVELWDGSLVPPAHDARLGRVQLKSEAALNSLLPPSEERIAQAFITGEIELQGDTIGLLEAAARWHGPPSKSQLRLLLAAWRRILRASAAGALSARLRGRTHSAQRDAQAVQHHYDVSNEFYRLFLDSRMVYSCGYFVDPSESLDEAQRAKLDLICRKLHLGPEDHLLDVGCGWGGLLLYAAAQYGTESLGITLSKNQLAEAQRQAAGLNGQVKIEAVDYRSLRPARVFDKIASVGMMEHVGHAHLDEYFADMFRLLRPGGLFLNHAIASITQTQTVPWVRRSRHGGFIKRYIFPDSELLPVGMVVSAAERAGFEVRDLESLREHYAQTLAHWLLRMERRFDEAVALVGRERARAWRLYLASSAVAFRLARISVFQLLLAKPAGDGRLRELPRSRSVWYQEEAKPTVPAQVATGLSAAGDGARASGVASVSRLSDEEHAH
jgi:cyclopropane-fatty-acyl-phospholipid synthase